MKITLTQDEARDLSRRWLETHIDQDLQVDLLPPPPSYPDPIGSNHKIALIKFARQLASDLFNNKISPSIDPKDGHLYFGLAEAKKYVETYFGWIY